MNLVTFRTLVSVFWQEQRVAGFFVDFIYLFFCALELLPFVYKKKKRKKKKKKREEYFYYCGHFLWVMAGAFGTGIKRDYSLHYPKRSF